MPILLARIIEWSHSASLRINRGEIRSLEVIALDAGPSQVIEPRHAAMFFGDDVISLVRIRGIFIVQQAVFATAMRSFAYLPA